jgi:hypothetical protein
MNRLYLKLRPMVKCNSIERSSISIKYQRALQLPGMVSRIYIMKLLMVKEPSLKRKKEKDKRRITKRTNKL